MNHLLVAHSCLMDVLYKKYPFNLAIDNKCSNITLSHEERRNFSGIVGCSLRHYYIFEYLISLLEKDFTNEQKVALLLYLSSNLFLPVYSSDNVDELIKKYEISKYDLDRLDKLSEDKTKLIPSELSNESIEYLRYRYNLPLWVLKIWMKHFKGYTFKICRSINKPASRFVLVNKFLMNEEEVNKENETLVPSLTFDGLYEYQGKINPSHHSLARKGKIVNITPAEYYLLKQLDLDVLRNIALYSEVSNNLHLQLMALLSNQYKMDVIAGASEAYYQTKKDIDNYNLNKVNLYECGHSSIITCLSEKVNNFFVMPANSNFAEFRRSPDYFNRVDPSLLDGYIANQKASLHSASEFVEHNGHLIYIVTTMNKKETIQIVDEFLNEHKNYVLVEQKQFLPCDKYDSTLFMAIFRNEGLDD